jgi:glycosyltransferase involved in cell wall biosynthesis
MSNSKPLTIVHFSADRWGHVCPVVRVTGPAELSGLRLLRGNDWQDGRLQAFPEQVSEADLVIIQRDFPRYAEAYDEVIAQARLHNRPVVYELDDLLVDLPETHPDYGHYTGVRGPILEAAASAQAVVCTTESLGEYLRQFNPHVHVWPNYLNDSLWSLRSIAPIDEVERSTRVIGYLGSHSHRPDLEEIVPVLERLLERYRDRVLLRLWGMQVPERLAELTNVESVSVGLVDYGAFARYFIQQECDVFIAPLLDNRFNRSKSSLKFLEYGALGVPGVYSRVTPYENIVDPGKTGFLASSSEEWEEYLVELLESPALRVEIGSAAQDFIRQNWLLSDHAHEWAELMRQILAARPAAVHSDESINLAHRLVEWNREDHALIARLKAENIDQAGQIEMLQNSLRFSQEQFASVKHDLDEITHSTGWRMLEQLYHWRLKIAPEKSWRERGMRFTVRKLRSAYRLGHGTALRLSGKRARMEEGPPASAMPVVKSLSFSIVQAEPARLPAISVVIEKNVLLPELDEQAVLSWAASQTLKSAIVVRWDRAGKTACTLAGEVRSWTANDLPELCAGLPTPYLCIASADLINQPPTYLEANWIALESHKLAFTLNANGASDWPVRHFERNGLPGARVLPLFRMVVRKEFVGSDFSLDLAGWAQARGGAPGLVGRLLHHTTAQPDEESAIHFENRFRGAEVASRDSYILARGDRNASWEPIVQPLFSPDQFWSPEPEPDPDDLPTIFLLQPFLAVGGAEDLALNIIEHLKDRARFVVIGAEPLDPELGTTADAFRRLTPYVYSLPDFLELELRLPYMLRLIERFQPVTYYIHNGSPWIYDVLGEIKKRFPSLYTVNQVYDSQVGWINRYDPDLVSLIDAHIGVNNKIRDAYLEQGVPPGQALLIGHGVVSEGPDPADYTPERLAEIKTKFGLGAKQKVITFAARLHPQKRPLDFIEIARCLKDETSIVFFLIGDGPLAGVVDEQIAKLELSNIHRHAFYRPFSDVLAATDILVLPSEYEGMPLAVAQAQLMGKPVVVTDVGNNQDVIDATGGGLVVPVGDVGAMVRGVQTLLEQKPDPVRMRQELLANFGMDVITDKYWNALMPER